MGAQDNKTINEDDLEKIFNDHQNKIDDKSSIYSTKSKTARRPIKSLANMRGGKIANQNKALFTEPSYAEKRSIAPKPEI